MTHSIPPMCIDFPDDPRKQDACITGPQPLLRVVATGIDTAVFSAYGNIRPEALDAMRACVDRSLDSEPGEALFKIARTRHLVYHRRDTELHLEAPCQYHVKLRTTATRLPTAEVTLRSEFLWSISLADALERVGEVLDWLIESPDCALSRLELAVDVQGGGFSLRNLPAHSDPRWASSLKRRKGEYHNSQPIELRFGSRRNVEVMVYNKSYQVERKPFAEFIWKIWEDNGGSRTAETTRVEVRVTRDEIAESSVRERGPIQKKAPAILAYANELWQKATSSWLCLLYHPSNRPPKARDWPTDPRWRVIQNERFSSEPPPVPRIYRPSFDMDKNLCSIAGYLTSFAAMRRITDPETVLSILQKELEKRGHLLSIAFRRRVEQKMARYGVFPIDDDRCEEGPPTAS